MNASQCKTNRRQWLLASGAVWAASVTGCGQDARGSRPGRDSSRELKVFNWSDYIADEAIAEFERRTGCRVLYDNYSSDSELETRLATGGGAYDVVFPSDRAMPALLAKNLLQEIDVSRLKNIRHVDEKFLRPPFDPANRFSVPYFWGTVAVGIRADFVNRPVQGFEILFDAACRGRITMLDDMENVVAAVLAHLGRPINSVADADLALVKRLLIQQRPLVQAYTSDSYKERLISGDAWACLGWSGDLMQAADEAAKLGHEVRVIVPAGGTMIWLDSMAIPRAAREVDLAHEFVHFLLEPAVAARNAMHVHYATPNRAAYELLPADMQNDRSVYPPPATLARSGWLENRGAAIERIEAIWREVRQ